MKKILFCTPYEGISNSNIGGISVWAKAIMAHYEETERQVELVLQPLDRKTYVRGVGPFMRLWRGTVEYFSLLRKLCKRVRVEHPDIVHLCTTASLGLIKDYFILRYTKSKCVGTVLHFHCGRIPEILKNDNWETWLLKRVLKNTDVPIVMDNLSLRALESINVPGVVYIPNPLSSFVRNTVSAYDGRVLRVKKRLLFVGHVVDIKGVYELVEACSRLSGVSLRMVGHVEELVKNELCRIASKRKGEWLCFTGGLSREETIMEMYAADALVAPSHIEGFPNVILEAMACATPIIASGVGAIPEMLDYGKCGIIIKPRSVDDICNAVENLFSDDEYKSSLAAMARERVNKEYSVSSVWSMLVNVWKG